MRRVCALAVAVLLLGGVPVRASAQVPSVSAGHDPYGARLVTADIDRFWTVFDAPSRSAGTFQRDYLDPGTPGLAGTSVVPTLLQAVLAEGVADYVAERATGIARTSEYVDFGAAHAGEVRTAFASVRASRDPAVFGEFLYGKPKAHPAWPQDLGYDIGYRIAKAYVARGGDERAAIAELIRMDDARSSPRAATRQYVSND